MKRQRPIFVFLYPFDFNDEVLRVPISFGRHLMHQVAVSPVLATLIFSTSKSLDACFAAALEKLGSLIALGKASHMEGAGRAGLYEDWQVRIKHTIAKADLIFFVVAPSPGVRDELEMIVSSGGLKKTIFIMPPKNENFLVPIATGNKASKTLSLKEMRAYWDKSSDVLNRHKLKSPTYRRWGAIFTYTGNDDANVFAINAWIPRQLRKSIKDAAKTLNIVL